MVDRKVRLLIFTLCLAETFLFRLGDGEIGDDGDDDNESYSTGRDEHDETLCSYPFHAHHWSSDLNEQRIHLQDLVQKHLKTIFQTRPSLRLFNALHCITQDETETEDWLFTTLSDIATTTSDTLVAALEIYSEEDMAEDISSLLDSHSYLLRPRDAPTLHAAVLTLAHSNSVFWHARSIQILEKEFYDCILAIKAAVRSAFSRIDDTAQKQAFSEILTLPLGAARQDRIQQWADAITTSSLSVHPMAFAAMMMGFPIAPGMEDGEDLDLNAYLDLGQPDPDLDALREEFKPNLEDRFNGWYKLSMGVKGGAGVSAKAYTKAVEAMPFLRASDAVNELLYRSVIM
jgi:hypothetical protein